MPEKIVIAGGGIIGVACGIALRLYGHEVVIYALESILDADAVPSPSLASAYPAASVLAHSVGLSESAKVEAADSEVLFKAVDEYIAGALSVRRQQHFKFLEGSSSATATQALPGSEGEQLWRRVEGAEKDWLSRCFPMDDILGFKRQIVFVEYPEYVHKLRRLAAQIGLRFERTTMDQATLSASRADVFVNCLGHNAHRLLCDDDLENGVLAGVLVHDRQHFLRDLHNGPLGVFSFNSYLESGPLANRNPDGSPTDLYFYPRRDCLVLGGTRQWLSDAGGDSAGPRRRPEREGNPPSTPADLIELDEIQVPASMLRAHERVLKALWALDLSRRHLSASCGYRPIRIDGGEAREAPPRIESTSLGGRPLIHCYGFGGSGVTLSWWAALRVLGLVDEILPPARRGLLPGERIEELEARLRSIGEHAD